MESKQEGQRPLGRLPAFLRKRATDIRLGRGAKSVVRGCKQERRSNISIPYVQPSCSSTRQTTCCSRAAAGCEWWQDQALPVAEGHRPGAEAGRPWERHGVTDARQSPLMCVRA